MDDSPRADLLLLYSLRDDLGARVDAGDEHAKPALRAVEDLISERESMATDDLPPSERAPGSCSRPEI
jgi:hypothetical protein